MLHRVPLPGRLGTALTERRRATRRWISWARSERRSGPLLWLHAASVGETIAAAPVVDRIRAAVSDLVVIHTFTSPTVVDWYPLIPADRSDYAPEDTARALQPIFDTLRPSLLMISRGDLWPGMVRFAERSGVPVAIMGATIRPDSRRLRWPFRNLMAGACRNLAFVGALTGEDASRWRLMGAPNSAVSVTGDPRDAAILERSMRFDGGSPLCSWAQGRPLMIAGSTHAEDERVLAAAFSEVARSSPGASLLVVPHDPKRTTPAWTDAAFDWVRWNGSRPLPDRPCVFAPVKGILADLYAWGTLAYVGGAFDRGAHSVAEAAAFGLPVVAGPRAIASPEARRFVEAGAVAPLPVDDAEDALAKWWRRLLLDASERWRVGLKGRMVLNAASARVTADAMLRLMAL